MGFQKEYFSAAETDPEPLLAVCERRVRFEEVDALAMAWHGRYPSYLEDGRIAFGDKYGMTYMGFLENKTVAPVVQMHLDYTTPLRFDDIFVIETRLHWADAARLNFSYALFNGDKRQVARGYTVQLLTEESGNIMLIPPPWLERFRKKWREDHWSN